MAVIGMAWTRSSGPAIQGLGERTAEGSGIINIAIFGGAVIPLVVGWIADTASLTTALLLPAGGHLVIAAFGIYARRTVDVAARSGDAPLLHGPVVI